MNAPEDWIARVMEAALEEPMGDNNSHGDQITTERGARRGRTCRRRK